MLARTPFLTADDLKIEPELRDALIVVLDKLERGELRHVDLEVEARDASNEPCGFNMGDWHCGTVRCIGGWADFFAKKHFDADATDAYEELTHPSPETSWEEITVLQAAQALRNYLTFGAADWGQVLGV